MRSTQGGTPGETQRGPEGCRAGGLHLTPLLPGFLDEKCIPLAASLTLGLIRLKLALASISTSFLN